MVWESRLVPIVAFLAALLAAMGIAPRLSAATVELHVVDELDQAIANTEIQLRMIERTNQRYYARLREMTDPGGRRGSRAALMTRSSNSARD